MSSKPVVAITLGDPCGIGPEVAAKALAHPEVLAACHPLVIGSAPLLERTARNLGLALELTPVSSAAEALDNDAISVLDPHNLAMEDITPGHISAAAGRASVEWIIQAAELAQAGQVQAMATGPIHKEAVLAAGYRDVGHMELLQRLSGAPEVATMLVAGRLRVVHLTTHKSLAQAVAYVKREHIMAKLRLTHRCFQEWGFSPPRIAVAALNPHGGEGGLLGREEMEEIGPAVEEARREGMEVTGPVPADSVFPQAIEGRFDAVLALYHDQGHIAIKVQDFDGSVSIALGLPFIRTSVDHGTAFDIAGRGIARETGMRRAIQVAAFMASKGRLPD
ncbi:MAG: 4-hydroxythreonine-4-phosphate dehydrogenase PdxA [Dehalococcoidia bacterium]|nr:4-hydroxythreonine-4-phosphate dehydrogenase PdxA [Dehalococcoidia bacterium]